MQLFRPHRRTASPRRKGILDELERLLRSARALPLAAPILLVLGLTAGEVTNRALKVGDDDLVRATMLKETPRVHLEALSSRMQAMNKDGERTVEYVTMYREHILPVEKVLRRHGVASTVARKISWPLVEQSYQKDLDPATVVAIVLVESGGKPTARSFVGARGLMQVMPLWAGTWRQCGRDLYDVNDNICNGTSILRWYLQQHGTDTQGDEAERKALLGYNGCVKGTNTPHCHTYPDKVWRLREQIKREIVREKAKILKTD